MRDSDTYELDRDYPNMAVRYTEIGPSGDVQPGQRRNTLFLHAVRGSSAGGGYSTVGDLLAFDTALRSHVLLARESTDLVLEGKIELSPGQRYAYGFTGSTSAGTRIVGHGGGFPGVNTNLDMFLELGYTVAVLANHESVADAVVEHARAVIARDAGLRRPC